MTRPPQRHPSPALPAHGGRTVPTRTIGAPDEGGEPLLPETLRLLEGLRETERPGAPAREGRGRPARVAAYVARPEVNLPFLRFHILEADNILLRFAGRPMPGFEVLQVEHAGLQYHWRSDLVRAFDERLPVVGRLCGLSDARDVVVEHLALPVILRHRIREIRGWFVFGQDATEGLCEAGRVSMFRRPMRSQALRLPGRGAGLEEGGTTFRAALGAIRSRWGGAARDHGGTGVPAPRERAPQGR